MREGCAEIHYPATERDIEITMNFLHTAMGEEFRGGGSLYGVGIVFRRWAEPSEHFVPMIVGIIV